MQCMRLQEGPLHYSDVEICCATQDTNAYQSRLSRRVTAYILPCAHQGGISLLGATASMPLYISTGAGEENLEDKATTRIFRSLGQWPISWASTKQDVIALSSTEAEYIALSMGVHD